MMNWNNGQTMADRGLVNVGGVWVPKEQQAALPSQPPTQYNQPTATTQPALPTMWDSALSSANSFNKENKFSAGDIRYKSASELAAVGTVDPTGKKKRSNGMWLSDDEFKRANMINFSSTMFPNSTFGQIS